VTGGGLAGKPLPPSWAAEGAAMRRAIAADLATIEGLEVAVTLDARLPDEAGPARVIRADRGLVLHLFGPPRQYDLIVVIAPEADLKLGGYTDLAEHFGSRTAGCSLEAIARCGDKYQLGRRLAKAGLPCPRGWRVHRGAPQPVRLPFPAVVKPIDGAGSVDTLVIDDPDEWEVNVRGLERMMAQPFVPGDPVSVSFLVGDDGEAWPLGVARQRIERVDNHLIYRGGILPIDEPAAIEVATRAIAEAGPGLFGWVGVDLIVGPGGDVTVIEINPRLTTSYIGWRVRYPPGALARAWLDLIEGRRPTLGPPRPGPATTFDADGTTRTEPA